MRHELYSNKFSKVVTPERTLQGTYFRSDERMTKYTVSNSKGSFMKETLEDNPEDTQTSPDDTTKVEPILRPAATKRAATKQVPVTQQMQR